MEQLRSERQPSHTKVRDEWRATKARRAERVACVCAALAAVGCLAMAGVARAQQRREGEPNSAYADRRAKLAAHIDGPIVLWGLNGREEYSEAYVFAQEDSFYYLTGHNEEGAGLIILPTGGGHVAGRGGSPDLSHVDPDAIDAGHGPNANGAANDSEERRRSAGGTVSGGRSGSAGDASGQSGEPPETMFLPPKNPDKEKWNGPRMSPTDPGIQRETGFASVRPFPELRAEVERLSKTYANIYTILPYEKELGGYPHEKEVVDWLKEVVPQAKLKDIRPSIDALRQVKSPGEIALLRRAIDLSLDAHLAAMKMMRPGLYEYQIAAKMVEVHAMGGSEAEGYAPIVGAGPNSTVLHYDKLARNIQGSDIVVMDVGAQFSGYSADITRTIPANGKFSARQREIYDIVLEAQNAAIDAVKPGMALCRQSDKSLFKIAYDYINTHGKDQHGKPLGQYFIHGLGHNIGLNVHDPGDYCKALQPNQVITIEPGIYIPEENLGVRIEDDVLVTATGHELLSERLARDPAEIEKIMAEGASKK